jgi:hypothetical protein
MNYSRELRNNLAQSKNQNGGQHLRLALADRANNTSCNRKSAMHPPSGGLVTSERYQSNNGYCYGDPEQEVFRRRHYAQPQPNTRPKQYDLHLWVIVALEHKTLTTS